MIGGEQFIAATKTYFSFLEEQFGFQPHKEKIVGNFYYEVQYSTRERIVSISYENVEEYLLVIVFLLNDGQLPNYDDKSKTLHLDRMSSRVFPVVSSAAIDENNCEFSAFIPTQNGVDKLLLKSAKELRLCLTYFELVLERNTDI